MVYLDGQDALVAGLCQQSEDRAHVDQPFTHGGAGEVEPLCRGDVPAHLHVLDVGGEHVACQLLHRSQRVVQEPQEVASVEVHAEIWRTDRFHQPEHLLGAVVTVVLRGKLDPARFGLADRLFEPARQHLEPRLAWLVAVVPAAGTGRDPHDPRTDQLGAGDLRHHVFECRAVRAVLEPGWMPPGIDPLQAVIVEPCLQLTKPRRLHAGEET